MSKRKGFTIVELLMVIGIIGVLTGIVTTAASGAVKNSRKQRAKAISVLVQAGLAAYHAQRGEWPITISETRSNKEGTDGESIDDIVILNGTEVRQCVKALVEETRKGTPVMDVSGLFVSRSQGELTVNSSGAGANSSGRLGYGLDFMSAIRGTRETSKKMKLSEMYFGYPDPETGKFLRHYMKYIRSTDTIQVTYWPGRGWE